MLAIVLLIFASCGSDNGSAIPPPGNTSWEEIGTDKSITVKHSSEQNLPLIDYDTESGVITVVKHFTEVIAWKQGEFVNLVAYSPLANGASLLRVNPAQKKVVYFFPVCGIGGIDHSQYSNRVKVYINNDLIMIVGEEGAGKYREIRRVADGSLVSVSQEYNKDWKPPDYIRIR